ncbi:MAG: hypothetical protein GY937_02965 [bacterium]|nr:hypothetical protein [bacterium]
MSDFEFTSVVVSILIAFAFSEVLASWGRIIKRRPLVKLSGLYLATSGILLLALVGHWLGMSSYRALPAISPAESLLVFSPSFLGALVAFILAPEFPESGEVDLSAHYFAVAPWVFSLLAVFIVLTVASDEVVLGQAIFPFWGQLARAGVLLIPAFSKRASVHAAVLVVTVLAPFILGAL